MYLFKVLHVFIVEMAYCVLHEKRLLRRRQSFHCIFDFVVGAAGQRPLERRHVTHRGGGGGTSSVGEETHMMTDVVALFSVPATREPRGGSLRDSATARSVPMAT
jgi:hypothetical protein